MVGSCPDSAFTHARIGTVLRCAGRDIYVRGKDLGTQRAFGALTCENQMCRVLLWRDRLVVARLCAGGTVAPGDTVFVIYEDASTSITLQC